eukprot:symbB.v1.2.035719.t1/scaffold4876.1/size33532/2
MFGCEYDSEKDACTSCTADDPLVVKYHIPASHLWPSREARILGYIMRYLTESTGVQVDLCFSNELDVRSRDWCLRHFP